MPNFFVKLIPPRPDFAQTLTPEERTEMGQHAAYVRLDMADEAEVKAFMDNDPTTRSGLNRYTVSPMILGGAQPPRASA